MKRIVAALACWALLGCSFVSGHQGGSTASRVREWQQDLDEALQLAKKDRSFTPQARREYVKAVEELKASVEEMNDYQVIVALSRAVGIAGNAHTGTNLRQSKYPFRVYPVSVYWFRDGLYVVRAAAAYRELVGCRVTSVAGLPPEQLRERFAALYHDNDSLSMVRTSNFVMPEFLYAMGVIPRPDSLEVAASCGAGEPRRVVLTAPEPLPPRSFGTAWQLSPVPGGDDVEWVGAMAAGVAVPLSLRHPERNYWFEFQPETGILYSQINRTMNEAEGEGLRSFCDRLLRVLDEQPVRAVVVDLRFNGGGNLTIARERMEKLRTHEKLRGPNRLFVITGRATFSAAIAHAAQLRQNPEAVFVGEPVGDSLEFWAEGGNIVLPNSRLSLHYSDGYHSYSKANPPEFRPYFFDLNIDSLEPDIPVSATFAEYAAGRDVAMEAILKRLK